jgi:uncharacterized NAD-dependent epimerase/dehydratase family protein
MILLSFGTPMVIMVVSVIGMMCRVQVLSVEMHIITVTTQLSVEHPALPTNTGIKDNKCPDVVAIDST